MSRTTEEHDLAGAVAEHRAVSQKEIRARQGTGKHAEDAAAARLQERVGVEDRLRDAGARELADALMSEHHGADRIVALLTGLPDRCPPNWGIEFVVDLYQRARRDVADRLAETETREAP